MFGQQQLEKPHAPPPQLQLQPNAQRRLRWAVYLRSDSSSNRSSTGTASSLPNGDGLGDYANPLPLARSIVGFVDLVFPHVPATPLKYYDAAKWRRREPPVPFLAARFSEKHAARGYTTEAVRAVLMHVFTADANFHFHNSNNNASFNFNFAPAIFTGPPRVLAAFEDSNPIRADAVKILERLGFRFGARCPPCLDADGWSLYVCERTLFLDSWTCV
ncbi:hypothetical protein HK100_000512 [Physocladia obscura]|uniref:Uncharacterized protein n=1 Tax=Physocladia obscura TaxID=109957 RepID=A0AAD5T0U0_9FUNG|nr:hypothetical protein HK100_000512 [Physocladia obscura]